MSRSKNKYTNTNGTKTRVYNRDIPFKKYHRLLKTRQWDFDDPKIVHWYNQNQDNDTFKKQADSLMAIMKLKKEMEEQE